MNIQEPVTQALAEFVATSSLSRIPQGPRKMADLCLLDWMGAAVAGGREPIALPLERTLRGIDRCDHAAVIGSGVRLSAPHAAMLNATLSHVLELDDVHHAAAVHGSAVVWAAVLAVAQWQRISAPDATLAFAVGYEVMARIGLACGQRMISENHHPTGVLGYFGAAAAAGRLLGLDATRQAMAFGIAAGQAGALTQVRGTMSKPFFAGHAAHGGILSALMAEQGFVSALDAIEGPQGVLATFAPQADPRVVLRELGSRWELEQNAFKVHASCAMSHAVVDGVLELRGRHPIDPREVAAIRLRLFPHASEYLNRPAVADGLAGKFSAQYCAAVALMDGQAQESQFTDERARDSALAALMQRVHLAPDSAHALDHASVDIEMLDGRTHRAEVQAVLGSPARALSPAELETKFLQLAGKGVGADGAQALLRKIRRWPDCEIDALVACTRHHPSEAEASC
ncbi:MAG: MmgE/PrpD family protein [Pseudomonadota bacterium]